MLRMLHVTRPRRLIVALIIVVCLADAADKAIERDVVLSARYHNTLQRWLGTHAPVRPRAPGNNFLIFRQASRHLLAGRDLYATYPSEHEDRFKYSPAFALLFTAFAYLPFFLGLFLWDLANMLALLYALDVLLGNRMPLAFALVAPEAFRALQTAQSNSLVAASIILAFVALERGQQLRAAAWIVLSTIIKIFPLVACTFALRRPRMWRFVAVTAALLCAVLLLPAVVTGLSGLVQQYRSWLVLERSDATAYMSSVMGVLHDIGLSLPNLLVQLLGLAVLLIGLLRASASSRDAYTRLASVLIFVVIFNHQAERPSYVIAMSGIAIWYLVSERAAWRTAALVCALVCISGGALFLPKPWLHSEVVTHMRLVMPVFIIWCAVQYELTQMPPGHQRRKQLGGNSEEETARRKPRECA